MIQQNLTTSYNAQATTRWVKDEHFRSACSGGGHPIFHRWGPDCEQNSLSDHRAMDFSVLRRHLKTPPSTGQTPPPPPQNTIHQVTTMVATSKYVLFPGHNHLPTQYRWPFTLIINLAAGAQAIIKVSCHCYQWLARGYDLEIGHF